MSDTPIRDDGPETYRARYLKLRSAMYDRTTGLPAIPVLLDRLRTALDDRRRLGVIVVTIDNLEMVESLYGWQVLDRILSRVAFLCREARGEELPAASVLAVNAVAGERFAAFVPARPDGAEVDAAYLGEAGRALRRRLAQGFAGEDFAALGPRLEFRVGHALLSQSPFYRFERRVYSALEQARSYDARRDRRRRRSRSAELKKILEGELLDTVFQPVVDLRTGALLGHEALARGPRDTLFEQPQAMFALSSEMGVAADLDRRCRRAALRASTGVRPRGKIFLNVLPGSLERSDRQDEALLRELREVALEPADVVLEFSDRGADGQGEALVAELAALRERGFGIALDDLGTGYASQEIVERARPDYLKLDISLVHEIHDNLIKQELLHTLVRIAARIDASVIAEGVEDQAEARTLIDAGAQYGQGYLYAGPTPSGAGLPRAPRDEAGH